jgi:hypothetical protein
MPAVSLGVLSTRASYAAVLFPPREDELETLGHFAPEGPSAEMTQRYWARPRLLGLVGALLVAMLLHGVE